MCLAVTGQVIAITDEDPLTRVARVSFLGVIKPISLALVPEARVDDYILVHAGVAIAVLDESAAQQTLRYLEQISDMPANVPPSP